MHVCGVQQNKRGVATSLLWLGWRVYDRYLLALTFADFEILERASSYVMSVLCFATRGERESPEQLHSNANRY